MRILICDDDAASTCGCESVVRALDKDAEILCVMDRSDVLAAVGKNPGFDLILWHVHNQPDEDIDILRRLSQFAIGVPIVVLANRTSRDHVLAALRSGAKGYVDLPAKKDLLLAILRLILAGGCYSPTYLLSEDEPEDVPAPIRRTPIRAERRPLTARQAEVLELLTAGHSNKEIAARLGIAPATAKLHVAAILKNIDADARRKLGAEAKG